MLRPLSLLLVLTAPAAGQTAPAAAAETDTTEAYETRRNHALAFPKYVWDAVVFPVGRLAVWLERKEVPQRLIEMLRDEDTFDLYPYLTLGGETGTAGGLEVLHTDLFGRGKGVSAGFVANSSNYSGAVRYDDPGTGGGPWYWNISVEALKTGYEDAAINGELRKSGSLLKHEQRDARIALGRRSNYGVTEGYEPDAAVELRLSRGFRKFASGDLDPGGFPGLNRAINLFSVGAAAAFDDRDFKPPTASISLPLNYQLPGRVLLFSGGRYYRFRDTAFPGRGGLARVEADYTTGSGDVRYFRYSAEFQRFFTLFFRNRILGIRARLDRAHGLGDGSIVPYSDLPGLGGDQRLRGYRRGFFRGAGSLLLSAEYRYPVWDTCNAFLFREEGQVFDRYGDLEAGRFEHGYGAGISVRTERDFLFGAYVARSREEKALTGFLVEKEF